MSYNLTSEQIQLAQESEKKYGVPASVTLGQFILESGAGTSKLYKSSNNAFGITGTYKGNYVQMSGRKWRAYSSLAESFDDHGALLSSSLYSEKTKGASNVSEYVDAISETYAPSSDGNNGYAETLKKIIVDNNLTQYDATFTGGNMTSAAEKDETGSMVSTVLQTVVKGIVFIFLGVLAVIFFVNAFEIPIPKVKMNKTKNPNISKLEKAVKE